MKKLLSVAYIGLLTFSAFAQPSERGKHSKFTANQIAELRTKKMTLHLDLTEDQQERIYQLHRELAIRHKEKRKKSMALQNIKEKPDKETMFKRANEKLDTQIVHQSKLKNILTKHQFETWKKSRKHRAKNLKKNRLKKHSRKKEKQHR